MKSYETEPVPLPRKTKALYIGLSAALAALGTALFVNGQTGDQFEKAAELIWGFILAGGGLFLLVQSIRKTHHRVITAAGQAARTADAKIAVRRRAQRNADLLGWAFIAAVIAVALYCFEPIADLFAGRIAAYPVYCSTTRTDTGGCANDGERVHNVTKYIVHVDQQFVVALTEKVATPMKLYNCVVADKKNWTCTMQPEIDSERLVMHDGEFNYDPPEMWIGAEHFTSRLEYLLTKYTH